MQNNIPEQFENDPGAPFNEGILTDQFEGSPWLVKPIVDDIVDDEDSHFYMDQDGEEFPI